MMELLKSLGTILFVLVVFIGVLYLAYKTTRLVGKHYGATVSGAKNIEILDKVALNQNQVLLIVKVCGKTMLLGSTENGITNLGEVDAEKLNNPPEIQPFSFSTILENIKNQKNGEERQQTDDRNVK